MSQKKLIPIRISEDLQKRAEKLAEASNKRPSEFYRDAVCLYAGLGDPLIMINIKEASKKLDIDQSLFIEIAVLRFCAEISARRIIDGSYDKKLPEFIMTAEGWLRGQALLTKLTEEYKIKFKENRIPPNLSRDEN